MHRPNLLTLWMALTAFLAFLSGLLYARADTPEALSFQGRVLVDGVPFTGTGAFRFALVEGNAASPVLHLDPPGGPSLGTVSLPVSKGLYSVRLGVDTIPVPQDLLHQSTDLRLRVWFNDGSHGLQQLSPDQPLLAVPYARRAATAALADTAGVISGNVPAEQIEGTLSDSQLPNTVARLDSAPTFTGTVTATGFRGPGTEPWTSTSDLAVLAEPNHGYLANREAIPVGFTLPATAQVGDVIRIAGAGAAGWGVRDADGVDIDIEAAGVTWTARETVRQWTSAALSADGRIIIACGDGTVHRSTDYGVSWSQPASPPACDSVAISADGQKMVAVRNGGRIHTSTDSGVTWVARDTARTWVRVASSSDGTRLVATAFRQGIFTSNDSGQTWTAREIGKQWVDVASSADGSRLIATWEGPDSDLLYLSDDFGVTWTTNSIPGVTRSGACTGVASSADGTRLVACTREGFVYRSTNSGQSWGRLVPDQFDFGKTFSTIASSADGRRLLAGVGVGIASAYAGPIYFSVDSGLTWIRYPSARNWTAVAMTPGGGQFVACDFDGHIYTSRARSLRNPNEVTEFRFVEPGYWRPFSYVTTDDFGRIPVHLLPELKLDASSITTGTLKMDRLPLLPASIISSGTFHTDRIPNLPATRIASGTFDQVRIPNLPAARIDSGTFEAARIPTSLPGNRDFSGTLAIGTSPTTTHKLFVKGNAAFDGNVTAIGFTSTSDSRLKTAVAPLPDALDRVTHLRGISFEWLPDGDRPSGRNLGFLAQEVALVAPELVHTNQAGFMSVQYDGVTPMLVEAVKELHQRFEQRLAEKDVQLQALRDRLAAVEARR
jgi:photosystem II stability/assembly factor-like uncharacterized protein